MKRENGFIHLVANCVLVLALLFVALGGAVSAGAFEVGSKSLKPYYRGNTLSKRVSLTFNVYQGEEYLPAILETLAKYDVRATFFVGGSWAARHPESLRSIVAAAQEVGNHGYLHVDHASVGYARNREEILLNHRLIERLVGVEMNLFAPPSGAFGTDTTRVLTENGYRMILWSKDTIDWRDKDENLIYKRATSDTQNGDIILMHPTEATTKALERIVKELTFEGFRLVSVSENIDGAQDF